MTPLPTVKSAKRALDILEFFAIVRRPATVSEIERMLNFPQSSVSTLLRSMVNQGYLEYLAETREFRPTLRVALLGSWLEQGFSAEPLAEHLDALQQSTRETVLLGRRQGASVQYIYSRLPDREVQFYIQKGVQRPMTITALGRALLSDLPEPAARKVIRRNNLEAKLPEHVVNETELLACLEEIRQTNISETNNFGGKPEGHVIATLIKREDDKEVLALGIAAPASRLIPNRDEIVDKLRKWPS